MYSPMNRQTVEGYLSTITATLSHLESTTQPFLSVLASLWTPSQRFLHPDAEQLQNILQNELIIHN